MAPRWVSRNLVLVWAARLAMSAARALAGVVVPLYLADVGFSGFELGELVAVVAVAAAALSTLVGLGSDRLGRRRPFLIVVPLVTAAAAIAYALSAATGVLFLAAAVGSFGRGGGAGAGTVGPYQPAESALVSEITTPQVRNSAFGRMAFMSSAGALIGGLAALSVHGRGATVAATVAAYRPAFIGIAVASAVAGLLALGIVEPARTRAPQRRRGLSLPRRSLPLLARLWATNSLNGVAIGMFGPFVTYWLHRRYGASAGEIGVLFAVINAAAMFATLSAARLARRWGLVRTVVVVRTVQAVLLVPMVLAPTFALAGSIYLVRMLVQRVGLPLRQSYVVAMADPAERSSVAALSSMPTQLAMATSPLAAGYLLDEVSLSLPFEISGALQVVNAGLYWWLFRDLRPEEEPAAERRPGPQAPAGERSAR